MSNIPFSSPTLPLEIKLAIIRFCDPDTLAKTALVSLAFLELSSPILYDHIEITGFARMAMLFCSRPSSSHLPHLDPYLSLRHIRAVTLTSSSNLEHAPLFSRDRILTRTKELDVDELTLRIISHPNTSSAHLGWNRTLFNPKAIHLIGHPLNSSTHELPTVDLCDGLYPELRLLTLTDVISHEGMGDWRCLRMVPSMPREVTVVFKPTKRRVGVGVVEDEESEAMRVLLLLTRGGLLEQKLPRLLEVLVESRTTVDIVWIQGKLEEDWERDGHSEEERERRRRLVRFEVV